MYKNKTENTVNKIVTFFDMLAILFIGLKLCGVISWSWWFVTMPAWMPMSVGTLLFIITYNKQ